MLGQRILPGSSEYSGCMELVDAHKCFDEMILKLKE